RDDAARSGGPRSSGGRAEPLLGGGATALGLALATARRRRRHQLREQVLGGMGDRVDGALERSLVRLGGLGRAADLPDVLERGGVDLLLGDGRLEVVEGLDVPAHGRLLRWSVSRRARSARGAGP